MERLLVTGVDSIIGSNLAMALADRCEVLGLYEHMAIESPRVRTAAWQADDHATLAAHVDDWRPQWILHCGPLAKCNWDNEPELRRAQLEPAVASQLSELAAHWGSALTVVSSDAVFSGPRMFHDEDSPASNPTPHAHLARELEQAVLPSDALVIRTHAYGWSVDGGGAGFAESIHEALVSGRGIAADGRRHATPILATDLAELLWRAYETRLRGLYHLAGAERTSAYRFAAELAASLGLPLPAARAGEMLLSADLCDETSLSSKRARRMLASATPMLREGLERFVQQAHNGWRNAWHTTGALCTHHEYAA